MKFALKLCAGAVLSGCHISGAGRLRKAPDVAAQVALEGRENIEIHEGFASQEQADVQDVQHVKADRDLSEVMLKAAVQKTTSSGIRAGCGEIPAYDHAHAKEYKDARPTFYNKTAKETQRVTFAVGDVLEFRCEQGFTTDGAKNGLNTYEVECTDHGYFKPKGVCMKASKCGPVPNITNAVPLGITELGRARMQCVAGYSLDANKVVQGGLGKNNIFELDCKEFSGEYEKFEGECKASAFKPSTETAYVYNKVTEALFVVSCQGTLKKSFGKGESPDLSAVCSKFTKNSGACSGLVGKIDSAFTAELAKKKTFEDKQKKDENWYNRTNTDAPKINEKAKEFCEGMWDILKFEPAAPTL